MGLLEKHFDLAFAAPDGIKKLRELVLTLAMQGKLVPQDPNDQPASELLEEIEAEKKRLVKEGKIKQSKPLPEIKLEEVPYNLPDGWKWVRVRNICHDWGQKIPDKLFTYIDVSAIDNKRGVISNDVQVLESFDAPSRARKIVCQGTVIYSTVRPYLLNIAIVDKDFSHEPIASTAFAILHPFYKTSNHFIYYYLRSPVFISYVESMMKGVAYPAINDGDFFQGLFPIPPFAEQRRIVAKIDELMARCDELEKLRSDRTQKRITVHTAALNRLMMAKDSSDFNTAWRFITQHFSELYSVKENVAELRKAILQLAVMGKLVPQDPNDQPASELLNAIGVEKERLVKEGKIKQYKPSPKIKPDEIPYDLPKGWEWVRIRNICHDWGQKIPDKLFTYIDVGSIDNKRGVISDDVQLVESINAPSRARKIVRNGTVIYSTVRPYLLNIAIVDKDFPYESIASTAFAILHPFCEISNRFIYYYLRSPVLISYVESTMKGVAYPAINDGDFFQGLFPLPPLAEQRRIVAKIDQLMTLCDYLEKQIDNANSKQTDLLNAVMAQV